MYVLCMYAHIRDKNALLWRLLSTVMGHCRCTELQKERGILRFPDFSQPLCRFHITADSKPRRRRRRRRRRHEPSVLQPRSHCSRPASSQIHLDSDKVSIYIDTTQSPVVSVFSHMFAETTERPRRSLALPGQASERCLAQTENEASFSA